MLKMGFLIFTDHSVIYDIHWLENCIFPVEIIIIIIIENNFNFEYDQSKSNLFIENCVTRKVLTFVFTITLMD